MVKALYGINSSKSTWRAHMAQSMYDVNVLSKANTDVLGEPLSKRKVLSSMNIYTQVLPIPCYDFTKQKKS